MEIEVLNCEEQSQKVTGETLVECGVPDISDLHIKTRLNPQSISQNTEEPRANGLQWSNGVYGSSTLDFNSQTPEIRTVDHSHFSSLGKY